MNTPSRVVGLALVLACAALVSDGSRAVRERASGKFDKAVQAAVAASDPTPMRVIVRSAAGRYADLLAAAAAAAGASLDAELPLIDAVAVTMRPSDVVRLAAQPFVARVSLDAPVRSANTKTKETTTTTEKKLPEIEQNHLLATLALTPTAMTRTGMDVGIAVIDSGIAPNGELKIVDFYTFLPNGKPKQQTPSDDFGHGTHVAGLIASTGEKSYGRYRGVAPGARLIGLKVLDSTGAGYTSHVVQAIEFAIQRKDLLRIDIVNLSLGHPIYEPAAEDPLVVAVEKAVHSGLVVVVSAGNFGANPDTGEVGYAGLTSPGNAPSAITVGSLDTKGTTTRLDDEVAVYSSRGPSWYDAFGKPDLVAPGHKLPSDSAPNSTLTTDYPGSLVIGKGDDPRFLVLSGTSMAAAVTTGTAALMIEATRAVSASYKLPPNAVKSILQHTAFPMAMYDELTAGAGALNAEGAMRLAGTIDARKPEGAWWQVAPTDTFSTIGAETLAWGQRLVWGDRVIWGNYAYVHEPAWALRTVWGDRTIWGNRIIWGVSTVFDQQTTWATRIVWGNSYIGATSDGEVLWGDRVIWGNVESSRVVWGNLSTATSVPAYLSWGNALRLSNGQPHSRTTPGQVVLPKR